MDTLSTPTSPLGFRADPRDYGVQMQILQDLGLIKVRLQTNNPKNNDAFLYHGHGHEVVEQVPIISHDESDRRGYLDANLVKIGHMLPVVKSVGNPAPKTSV